MDLIGVWLSKNTAKSINLGYRLTGNFTLMTAVLTHLEMVFPDLSAGPF